MEGKPYRSDQEKRLGELLPKLTDVQIDSIVEIVEQLARPYISIKVKPDSNLLSSSLAEMFGDAIRVHHCFSAEPLSKDRFEYALERAANLCGIKAARAPRGNPGHDITINNQLFSLKTEAAKAIKYNSIHISKFMELGKGKWELEILRGQFLNRLSTFDRVLTLRCLGREPWRYELVEIPKSLLSKAQAGKLRLMDTSEQNPKPGYCDVEEDGKILFQLYFDGGTERKLQIKYLQKSLCVVHGEWVFGIENLSDPQTGLGL